MDWRSARLMMVVAALAAVVGCAGPTHVPLLAGIAAEFPADAVSGRHMIYVATTRMKSEIPAEVFSGGRAPLTSFAAVDITVPKAHVKGQIERRKRRQAADPSRFFVAHNVTAYGTETAFQDALRTDLKKGTGRALVFVHGYNTAFDGAVYRMTQIVHDSGYDGTPVLFTWASGGKAVDYVYDSNSASAARDALEATLRMVARSGAERIDIIAHSMGNWVTMEALRQLAISGDRDLGNRLGDVVLASPDIDVDVFKAQMRRYGKPDKPFILFLSRDDRALRLSGFIAGNRPRVGDYGDAKEIAELGVIAVDLSQLGAGDRLNHTKFADNPVLISILGDRLREDDQLEPSEQQLTARINELATGVGGTLGSAAAVVVTTPFEVINIMIGQ